MLKSLIDTSIEAALKQDWAKAISLNHSIIKELPNHIPTLNRLAKAYKEAGFLQKAKDTYQQVLSLDKYNAIALNNLKSLEKRQPTQANGCRISTDFIEEPGKTNVFKLTRLGSPHILSSLQTGQVVNLALKKHAVSITLDDNTYIGALTDDVSYKLKKCVEAGSSFEIMIKSCATNTVTVFIREIIRAETLLDNPDFLL